MSLKFTYSIVLLLMVGGLLSCKKDKVPLPAEPNKWEKIAGTYKVYDTTGVYLYEMEIIHVPGPPDTNLQKYDSLLFLNFNNKFNFTAYQGTFASNWPETMIRLWPPNPTNDIYGKRWQLNGLGDNAYYYNTLKNDTIRFRYKTVNILYYISDLTPYCDSTYSEIAVKQH